MNFSDKRTEKNYTGLIVVVLLHALVGWAFVNGLGTRVVAKITQAVEAEIIEEVKPPEPQEVPPPPPPPEMKAPPPPFIPPVEVNVQQPPPPQNVLSTATNVKPATNTLPAPAPAQPASAPAPVANPNPVRSAAVVDFNTCAKPEWPKASLRNEETGTVTLSFLIGADGRVADSKIVKSSGFRDLDRAAVNGIARCRFKPAMVDGKPEQTWQQMQYVWTLE